VRSRPRLVLRSRYKLSPEAEGTRVAETVFIECPRLLAGTALRQAERAHQHLLTALKERLEQIVD